MSSTPPDPFVELALVRLWPVSSRLEMSTLRSLRRVFASDVCASAISEEERRLSTTRMPSCR